MSSASSASAIAVTELGFSDRVAVVTGGASGIGAAMATRLQRAGATVVVWDRERAQSSAADTQGTVLDVTDHAAVARAREQVLAAFGRIDILVASAGITGPTLPLVDYSPADWRRVLAVNLNGLFYCCRVVVPAMIEQGYGRIVNIASLAGKEGTANAAAYSASKAGVITLTKSLGKELAQSGVLANCIAPAAVETALLQQMAPVHVETMIAKSPLGRLGHVEEVVELAAWLASERCSFNTGAVFDLSGGRATY